MSSRRPQSFTSSVGAAYEIIQCTRYGQRGPGIPVAVVVDWGAHLYQGGGLPAEHLNVQDFSLQLACDECQVSTNDRPGWRHGPMRGPSLDIT